MAIELLSKNFRVRWNKEWEKNFNSNIGEKQALKNAVKLFKTYEEVVEKLKKHDGDENSMVKAYRALDSKTTKIFGYNHFIDRVLDSLYSRRKRENIEVILLRLNIAKESLNTLSSSIKKRFDKYDHKLEDADLFLGSFREISPKGNTLEHVIKSCLDLEEELLNSKDDENRKKYQEHGALNFQVIQEHEIFRSFSISTQLRVLGSMVLNPQSSSEKIKAIHKLAAEYMAQGQISDEESFRVWLNLQKNLCAHHKCQLFCFEPIHRKQMDALKPKMSVLFDILEGELKLNDIIEGELKLNQLPISMFPTKEEIQEYEATINNGSKYYLSPPSNSLLKSQYFDSDLNVGPTQSLYKSDTAESFEAERVGFTEEEFNRLSTPQKAQFYQLLSEKQGFIAMASHIALSKNLNINYNEDSHKGLLKVLAFLKFYDRYPKSNIDREYEVLDLFFRL